MLAKSPRITNAYTGRVNNENTHKTLKDSFIYAAPAGVAAAYSLFNSYVFCVRWGGGEGNSTTSYKHILCTHVQRSNPVTHYIRYFIKLIPYTACDLCLARLTISN